MALNATRPRRHWPPPPTRHGRMAPEMSAFFDRLAAFHSNGCALKGKIGSSFTEVGLRRCLLRTCRHLGGAWGGGGFEISNGSV